MRRDSEFRWQPQSASRSKLALSMLIALAGVATGYMVVNADEPDLETASAPPAARPAIEEPSGVATAAPLQVQLLNPSAASRLTGLVSDEPSVVTTAPPDRAPNAALNKREEPAPPRSVTRQRRPSSYGTLRQALLRGIR
jgi:hypothetical protein